MQLSLKYNPTASGIVSAAFVAGQDARTWLTDISRWSLPPGEMSCYILPASVRSPLAAGLFVVFKNPDIIKGIELLEPYVEIAPKLFIPLHSKLFPEIRREEWKKLLIWDCQVFHPVSGFIGFENTDRVEMSALFSIGKEKNTDWSFANPGLSSISVLRGIAVEQPSSKELMDSIKEDIGQKPLEDIPKVDKEPSWLKNLLELILAGILSLFSFLFFGLLKLIPVPTSSSSSSSGSFGRYSSREGWLNKLSKWIEKTVGDLQSKRDKEMERLLKMFDKDDRDALQYAIPLDSPYMNRGENTGSSSRLIKRLTSFNLGGLRGGGAAEVWNIDNYRTSLRAKYLESANKEIARKDFRRAAYIHAHLLGDYHAAANCLEQGGLFREAATLYKDHLNNIDAAASCLERGHLYTEAIELYDKIGQHEKSGDLYLQLENDRSAIASYEKHIEAKLKAKDYLDAARVLNKKVKDDNRAKEILLTGWHSPYQAETCLKRYFDIVNEEELSGEIKQVYTTQLPPGRKRSFLDVLSYLKGKNKDEKTGQLVQDLAYEIIHDQAEAGDLSILQNLPGFVPEDRLLKGDSVRYLANNQTGTPKTGRSFFIDRTIAWKEAIRHKDQILVLGERNDLLQLARINEQGVADYFSWSHIIPRFTRFSFVHNPQVNNTIMLRGSKEMVLEDKTLVRNSSFAETVFISSPPWVRQDRTSFVMTGENEVLALSYEGAWLLLNHYNLKGEIQSSIPSERSAGSVSGEILYLNQHFYSFNKNIFIEINGKGKVREFDLTSGIRLFGGSSTSKGSIFIVSTNKGCHLLLEDKQGIRLVEEIFFKSLIPTHIVAVSARVFAIAAKTALLVVAMENAKLEVYKEYSFETKISAVLPGRGGGQFVVVEENGRVSLLSYN